MLPPPAVAKFSEVRLPTLRKGEPFARDTVVRTCLPFRHGEEARSARGIGAFGYSRARPSRAMKINMAPCVRSGRRMRLWIIACKANRGASRARRALRLDR